MAGPLQDPLDALLATEGGGALAVIIGVEGPSYRPVGAMMAILGNGKRVGSLSSGCIEADIALHAKEAMASGQPKSLRYGRGSPFKDIELPCGGGLDILIVPNPDANEIAGTVKARADRRPIGLCFNMADGTVKADANKTTGQSGSTFCARLEPEVRFLIFGKGPEACTFAALVHSGGYSAALYSPDDETLDACRAIGCDAHQLVSKGWPEALSVDDRTAIVLFFHDHEWEPPILIPALETPAFYIGAQGSLKTRDTRHKALLSQGVAIRDLERIKGPIGLIQSARDPGTLAVSVLAEVLSLAGSSA